MGMAPEARDPALLWDMRNAARTLTKFLPSASEERLRTDFQSEAVAVRGVQRLAVAANAVSGAFKDAHREISWSKIARQLNNLEEFDRIDYASLAGFVSTDMPQLARTLEALAPTDPVGEQDAETGTQPADPRVLAPLGVEMGAIEAFCRKHRIRSLWLFGSVLTADFGTESDVDVLVEFDPGERLSLGDFVGVKMELEQLVGREVDLLEPKAITNPFRRKEILSTRQLLYAA